MTRRTLEKIENDVPKIKSYLDCLKKSLNRFRDNENRLCEVETKHEIYGTINTLLYLNIITQRERQILYCYYAM